MLSKYSAGPRPSYVKPSASWSSELEFTKNELGLDVDMDDTNEGFWVVDVTSDASEVGALPGDIITTVNDISVRGITYESLVDLLAACGRPCKISVLRSEEQLKSTVTHLLKKKNKLNSTELEKFREELDTKSIELETAISVGLSLAQELDEAALENERLNTDLTSSQSIFIEQQIVELKQQEKHDKISLESDRRHLESLSRKQLQVEAKKFGIRANMTSKVIIDRILDINHVMKKSEELVLVKTQAKLALEKAKRDFVHLKSGIEAEEKNELQISEKNREYLKAVQSLELERESKILKLEKDSFVSSDEVKGKLEAIHEVHTAAITSLKMEHTKSLSELEKSLEEVTNIALCDRIDAEEYKKVASDLLPLLQADIYEKEHALQMVEAEADGLRNEMELMDELLNQQSENNNKEISSWKIECERLRQDIKNSSITYENNRKKEKHENDERIKSLILAKKQANEEADILKNRIQELEEMVKKNKFSQHNSDHKQKEVNGDNQVVELSVSELESMRPLSHSTNVKTENINDKENENYMGNTMDKPKKNKKRFFFQKLFKSKKSTKSKKNNTNRRGKKNKASKSTPEDKNNTNIYKNSKPRTTTPLVESNSTDVYTSDLPDIEL